MPLDIKINPNPFLMILFKIKVIKKINRKILALTRVTHYIYREKGKILINVFFGARFNFCSLILGVLQLSE